MSVFYLPVYVYIVYLMTKHRSTTAFTAANPAIPHSGFALESKRSILDALGEPTAGCRVAPYAVLDRTPNRASACAEFVESAGGYPIVLKPDIGERGQGVAVIRNEKAARRYLESCDETVIAQEFMPGLEFGIFYYQFPNSPSGEILSITEKRLLSVSGDGERSLEELILADERAMRMAEYFLDKFGARIAEIPAPGESIALAELGTHCRGSVFLDGSRHITEALREQMHVFSSQFAGFWFGRYDVKVPTVEDLRAGRNLSVLELNGVSSESTNVYDPGCRIWNAYGMLWRQWDIAFEIGKQNIAKGARESELSELTSLIREHGRRKWFEADDLPDHAT